MWDKIEGIAPPSENHWVRQTMKAQYDAQSPTWDSIRLIRFCRVGNAGAPENLETSWALIMDAHVVL